MGKQLLRLKGDLGVGVQHLSRANWARWDISGPGTAIKFLKPQTHSLEANPGNHSLVPLSPLVPWGSQFPLLPTGNTRPE